MGNPLNYRDGMSFAWENGRWLKTVTKNGNTINMQYDINGLRTQKGNTHYYYDTDNNLIAMVKGNDRYYLKKAIQVNGKYQGSVWTLQLLQNLLSLTQEKMF